jgi:putative transposase
MNPPKCNDLDYIQFLIASQHTFTATEAAKTHPDGEEGPAHDAYTRLLYRTQSDGYALWQEVKSLVTLQKGMLVLDDSTLDKLYAQQMDLVTYHWSGKHKAVVKGINLLSLLWTDGEARLPCDFRIYNKKQDGLTKNDHFREMLREAQQRGFEPELVAFDSWYASLKNLKLLRRLQWPWLCRLQKDRQVDPDGQGNRQIQSIHIPRDGRQVHLKGYGWVKVFRTVGKNGNAEYWATSDREMSIEQAAENALCAWQIEVYHRGLKQFTGIEKSQHRKEIAQRNHIGLALRAYLRLEVHRLRTGISWFEAKANIIRDAIRSYLADPEYTLSVSTA